MASGRSWATPIEAHCRVPWWATAGGEQVSGDKGQPQTLGYAMSGY